LDGVKIGVTTRFDLLHKSVGETNDQWDENRKQFEEKFKDVLPLKMTHNKSQTEKLNYTKDDIGIGMVTYKAEDRIKESGSKIPGWVKHFVIVNDGTPYDESSYPEHAHVIQHEENKSVGQAKTTAINYLLEQDCDHIFIIEDDILIQDEAVFDKYIQTSLNTGVKHLNFALHGPANKKGAKGFENLDERAQQENLTEPNPRQVIKYPNGFNIAMYPNSVGAFSYYQREVLDDLGGFDEVYKNAWEHVDHTMQAFKKGYTTPYWWFADIDESWKYLNDIDNSIENSTIGHTPEWQENYRKGYLHFKKKHGFGPTEVPDTKPEHIQGMLNHLFQNK